jgi:hypothetical protein
LVADKNQPAIFLHINYGAILKTAGTHSNIKSYFITDQKRKPISYLSATYTKQTSYYSSVIHHSFIKTPFNKSVHTN